MGRNAYMERHKITESIWYTIRPLAVYMVIFSSVQAILYRLIESYLLAAEWDMAYYYTYYGDMIDLLVLSAAMVAGVIPCLRDGKLQIEKMESRPHAWIEHRRDASKLLWMMPVGVVCIAFALNIPLTYLSGSGGAGLNGTGYILGAAVYGVLSPCVEELVFRGIVYGRLRLDFSFHISALGSAILFGLYHGNIWQALYGLIMGYLFALFYELTHRFAVPFLLHGGVNLIVLTASSTGVYSMLAHPVWFVVFGLGFAMCANYYVRRLRQTHWNPRK